MFAVDKEPLRGASFRAYRVAKSCTHENEKLATCIRALMHTCTAVWLCATSSTRQGIITQCINAPLTQSAVVKNANIHTHSRAYAQFANGCNEVELHPGVYGGRGVCAWGHRWKFQLKWKRTHIQVKEGYSFQTFLFVLFFFLPEENYLLSYFIVKIMSLSLYWKFMRRRILMSVSNDFILWHSTLCCSRRYQPIHIRTRTYV